MRDRVEMKYDVLIAGGGFGGVYAAKALARAIRRDRLRVGLIARENVMVFQPLLAEVVGASISPRHVVSPLRLLCPGVDVLRGTIRSFDLAKRRCVLSAGETMGDVTVGFRHVLLALGSVVDLGAIPGMAGNAFLLKTAGDALALRTAIIDRLEAANLLAGEAAVRPMLSFVVVGGGFSGVETAGQILDLLHGIHRFYRRVEARSFRVVLIHSREFLLPELSERLGRYCQRTLEARGLEVMLGERVASVTANEVRLESGRAIECRTVVATVGNAPHPLLTELMAGQNWPAERGRPVTDRHLRVAGQECVWAVGDGAAVPRKNGEWCPPTAQFAMRQGALAGANMLRSMRGRPLVEFRFEGVGALASTGHRKAVADLFGVQFSGFVAWFLWRTLYLLKLPGLDRKLRVMLDWTLDLFFPRDIAVLRPSTTPASAADPESGSN
jgi:NADH dehydrogenase